MRKYVIGALFGFFLSLGFGAYADDIQTAIGKTIDGEFFVTVNDQKLPVKAITSEGTSYVPLRSFGESQGYMVTFDADLGINLTKKTVGDSVYKTDSEQPTENPKYQKIRDLNAQKDTINQKVIDLYQIIKPYESIGIGADGGGKTIDDVYTKTIKERQTLMQQRDDLEQQIKELAKQP